MPHPLAAYRARVCAGCQVSERESESTVRQARPTRPPVVPPTVRRTTTKHRVVGVVDGLLVAGVAAINLGQLHGRDLVTVDVVHWPPQRDPSASSPTRAVSMPRCAAYRGAQRRGASLPADRISRAACVASLISTSTLLRQLSHVPRHSARLNVWLKYWNVAHAGQRAAHATLAASHSHEGGRYTA